MADGLYFSQARPSSPESPTDCDSCGDPILYGVTCYAVPTGREDEGRPVVRIVCETCHATPDA